MTEDREATATFMEAAALYLTAQGPGGVQIQPGGGGCAQGTCPLTFPKGTTVTLTPIPNQGAVFQGWSGECTGTTLCQLTVNTSHLVTATFVAGP
jgi:hypothetical protein